MDKDTRFTLLPFPQFYDGGTRLDLRLVLLPRNQNPLQPATEPPTPGIVAFAEAALAFEAKIVSSLNDFPWDELPHESKPLPVVTPTQAKTLFQALKTQFKITDPDRDNSAIETAADNTKPQELTVKKYLPISYRGAFNFTTARTRNAVTDDSYRCAVRDAKLVEGFKRSPDEISWGKVFAYALRQPLLAEKLGMIYETHVTINATHFPKGGWLYVDLAAGSDYHAYQQTHPAFIKRYAARIPALKPGTSRRVFAPVLFPVLYRKNPTDPDPPPDGIYDELFIEAAEFDDGFAKVVHAYQPRSRDLLAEENDGAHPVNDVGIRLGWDDEQILIWYMRQMMIDPTVTDPSRRLDAPLGVFGYAIDVRESATPENAWTSLNEVESEEELSVKTNGQAITIGDFTNELPYAVYPARLDGDKNKNFWLPMYFANWNGNSMVLPDRDAAEIYFNTDPRVKSLDNLGVTGPTKSELNKIYKAVGLNTKLRYGKKYEFRVRLRDLSGGGIPPGVDFVKKPGSSIGKCDFKRYVAPNQLRIRIGDSEDLPVDTDSVPQIEELKIRRPLLGYPAAVYTGKYNKPVEKLKAASKKALDDGTGQAFGVSDPDVDRVEVTVEVQALRMDNLLSVSGKENYVHLYTTHCKFPAVNNEQDFDDELIIPIVYKDCPVLHVGDAMDLTMDLGLPANFQTLEEIVLPTARTIRLTLRAVCEAKANNEDYYGVLTSDEDRKKDKDVRYGAILQVMMYKQSGNEKDLFSDTPGVPRLQGVFLQPDPPQVFDGTAVTLLLGNETERPPEMIERLAMQLGLERRGLTLTGQTGERVQFGCSNRIRHTLAPENSSITFSSKGDLMNHWLCCISVRINRDWTWDGLEDRAFVFTRTKRFTHDKPATETEEGEVGDIEIRHTAPFEALVESERNYTRLVFIDAVEPKNSLMQPAPNSDKPRFPDTIEVNYSIETRFKAGHGSQRDDDEKQDCRLPITTPPAQIPKIASVGLALSPYDRNAKYSSTEPRRRYLWVEFAEPLDDPNDHYFARVLAYAPDQLISNNRSELFVGPEEPPLPIDPEYIRSIRQDAPNDRAGLRAMQPMKKATDSDRHYLLPLPPKLHPNADEMFGFFTYEFRVGHYKDASTPDADDFVWCTARGRFGRRLRVTGVQHPAPTLTCMVDRDEEKLYVSAPYAVAVFDGKNVTADPPRTQLWCLLYAQVKQADNLDYRNILLDDKHLDYRVQIEREEGVNWFLKYNDLERKTLKKISINNWKDELDFANYTHLLKLKETLTINKDATKYGTVAWSNHEISQLLELYGLPTDSPLSVLVVEFLPTITKFSEHFPRPTQREMLQFLARVREEIRGGNPYLHLVPSSEDLYKRGGEREADSEPEVEPGPSPVSDALGHQRILRTSPLTEVPFICCTDC